MLSEKKKLVKARSDGTKTTVDADQDEEEEGLSTPLIEKVKGEKNMKKGTM